MRVYAVGDNWAGGTPLTLIYTVAPKPKPKPKAKLQKYHKQINSIIGFIRPLN